MVEKLKGFSCGEFELGSLKLVWRSLKNLKKIKWKTSN